ncbi:MAG: hypothetical protein ACOC2N_04775 [Spirochaetota bacterium]
MTATEWKTPQEILSLQEIGRRQAEEAAEIHPRVRARDTKRPPPVTLPEAFHGIWRYVRDDRNQLQDLILHVRADGYFSQVLVRTEHGDVSAFAARGPIVEDENGSLHFLAQEVRQFEPNFNWAGAWGSSPEASTPIWTS